MLLVAGAAALVNGCILGTQMTIEDEAWPARGGIEALIQMWLIFGAYSFIVATAVGALLSVTLSPLMANAGIGGPTLFLCLGLLLGLSIHLLADIAIRERIDSSEDFLGGTVAGGVAGLLWWYSVQRHIQKVRSNG